MKSKVILIIFKWLGVGFVVMFILPSFKSNKLNFLHFLPSGSEAISGLNY